MSKWVCVFMPVYGLTLNKVYDAIWYTDTTIRIINDKGTEFNYSIFRFKSLANVREEQIKIVLDD